MTRKIFGILLLLALTTLARSETVFSLTEKNKKVSAKLTEQRSYVSVEASGKILEGKYLVFEYHSEHLGTIYIGAEKGSRKKVCSGRKMTCVLNMEEEKNDFTNSYYGYQLMVKMACDHTKQFCEGSLSTYIGDFLINNLSDFDTVFLKDVDMLRVDVKDENKDLDKIRLTVQGKGDGKGNTLKAFGNFDKSDWPSQSTYDFNLDNIKPNEVGVLFNAKDKYFCKPDLLIF